MPDHFEGAEDQPFFQEIRQRLRSQSPLDLLDFVSTMVSAVDPRNRNPFEPHDQTLTLENLLDSLIGPSYAETTAALTVLRELVVDEDAVARIDQALASRHHPLPVWLARLGESRLVDDVWRLTHVLGDGDDYFLGAELPGGHPLTALVYVDHNMGTAVKDAFVVPEPIPVLLDHVNGAISDPDQSLARFDPATTRAVTEDAIRTGSLMFPPLESDSWPMCRPLVEWLIRKLPTGGVLPARQEWSDDALRSLAADFFGSRFGDALDHPDERGLLDSVLWFGTDYGPGDPLRWSPVNVEILMSDWFPRKIVAEPAYLAKMPELLRAFIRYAHDRSGIRATLTSETLAAVDTWEPDYQRLIRSDRPQGPAALLAGLFGDHVGDLDASTLTLEYVGRAVGGRLALMALDDQPLPDEPFEWAGVPDDIRYTVQEILDTCDRCAAELLDTEHRTAMRRFLSRAAAGDPALFRRKASPVRGAAAVAWVICRANESVGYSADLTVAELLAWFGVKGSVSQRAEPMLRANGVDPHDSLNGELGSPALLVSTRRRKIIEVRDRLLEPRDE